MRRKNLLRIFLVALLLTSVGMVGTATASPPPRMYVDPPLIEGINPPNTFTVDIKVDVDNLYGWDFVLKFDPGLLEALNVTSGQFLEESGWDTAWQLGYVTPEVDNLNGLVGAGDLIMPDEYTGEYPLEGVSGTGRAIATIEFRVIHYGICTLDLESTELGTVVGEPPYQQYLPMDHKVEGGIFDNRLEIWEPTALFTIEHTGMVRPVADQPITFDASASNDDKDGGWIVSYDWDFGDGTTDSGMVVDHTFAEVGTYTVTLTVTDNDGLTDTASDDVTVVEWMEGGAFPDILDAWAEKYEWNEVAKGRELKLFGLVGNPTEDAFEVYVEFTIYSTVDAAKLGTIVTDPAIIYGGENLELSAIMDLRDTRWRTMRPHWTYWSNARLSNQRKYTVFARCYHRPVDSGDFEKGFAAQDFGFKVLGAEHDIAVLDVTTNVTSVDLLEIYVTIDNQGGNFDETFNITVTYKGLEASGTVEVRPTELKQQETRTETFTLDISELPKGPYIIDATLSTLTYEEDVLDNSKYIKINIE